VKLSLSLDQPACVWREVLIEGIAENANWVFFIKTFLITNAYEFLNN